MKKLLLDSESIKDTGPIAFVVFLKSCEPFKMIIQDIKKKLQGRQKKWHSGLPYHSLVKTLDLFTCSMQYNVIHLDQNMSL